MENQGNWTLPMNLLPRSPELMEPVAWLGRVRPELSSKALHWTHSLPVRTLLPAAPVPLVWGTVRCSIRRLLVSGEREGLGRSSPSASMGSVQTEDDSRSSKIRSSILPTGSEGLAVNTGRQNVPALQEAKSQIRWSLHHHQANEFGHLPTATSSTIKSLPFIPRVTTQNLPSFCFCFIRVWPSRGTPSSVYPGRRSHLQGQ